MICNVMFISPQDTVDSVRGKYLSAQN